MADQVFEMDKASKASMQSVRSSLQTQSYNWILSPHRSFRTALLVSGLSAQRKIGFWGSLNFWAYEDLELHPASLPDAIRQLQLLKPLSQIWRKRLEGSAIKELHNTKDQKALVFSERAKIPDWAAMGCRDQILQTEEGNSNQQDNLVLLAPGSVWATKRWRKEHFANLIQILMHSGFGIGLIGSPEERTLAVEILNDLPPDMSASVQNKVGELTLMQTLLWMSKSEALIANDSGAMHLASVAELPAVGIFGPTTLGFGYRPWQNRSAIAQIPLPCRPCRIHGSQKCPIGTHECMKNLKPSLVFSQLQALLRE